MGMLEKINEDILDYNNGFEWLFIKIYLYVILPISCLHIFHRCYLPVILNHWFSYPADTKFENANPSWGFLHTFFYNCVHPSMDYAVFYNTCSGWETFWFIVGLFPGWLLLYTAIYTFVFAGLYWGCFNLFFGGLLQIYSEPFKK